MSKLYQTVSKRKGKLFLENIKKSFRNDLRDSFFNGTLALLCLLLAFISLHPIRTTQKNISPTKTNHSLQLKAQEINIQPLKAEAAIKTPQKDKNTLINKLAEEASKKSSTSPDELKQNITNIVESLNDKEIATPRVIAYAMATAERETAKTFKPIEEYGGPQQAMALGYSGGERYYGRGYIQITHDYNYAKFGEEIGMGDQLLINPELALDPKIASDILAEFFKDNGVAATAEADFIAARGPINGYDHAEAIAYEAEKYLETIEQVNN